MPFIPTCGHCLAKTCPRPTVFASIPFRKFQRGPEAVVQLQKLPARLYKAEFSPKPTVLWRQSRNGHPVVTKLPEMGSADGVASRITLRFLWQTDSVNAHGSPLSLPALSSRQLRTRAGSLAPAVFDAGGPFVCDRYLDAR